MLALITAKKGCIEAFMGVFRQQKAIDTLEDRLRTLEVKCDDLERAKRTIDLEFTELYDKVRHQMSRMAKRDARAAKVNGEEIVQDPASSHLDSLDPISRAIHER